MRKHAVTIHHVSSAASIAALFASPHVARAQCQDWLPGQPAGIVSGDFRAGVLFDSDADGPLAAELLVAGDFSFPSSSGSSIDDLAAWNGVSWRRVIQSFLPISPRALTTFDFDGPGPLPPRAVVAGQFSLPGNLTNICTWNGELLQPLATGLSGSQVSALHVFDPDADGPLPASLYAAGQISSAGGTPIPSGIARWNGSAWEDSGAGLVGTVNALASFDLDGPGPAGNFLIAAGNLRAAGIQCNVAILNATEWIPAGAGLNGEVRSLALADLDGAGPLPERLLAAGSFTQSGAVANLRGNAFFDGARWQAIAPLNQSGIVSTGRAIGVFDLDGPGGNPAQILLSGSIRPPGSQISYPLVSLQNGAWVPITPQSAFGDVNAMRQFTLPGDSSPVLLTLGNLRVAAQPQTALNLGIWNGTTISPFSQGFTSNVTSVTTVAIDGEPRIVAIGGLPGIPAYSVGAYDGDAWTRLGDGDFNGLPTTLATHDPDGAGPIEPYLVAAGGFDTAPGGVPAAMVARWNGKAWEPMGAGLPSLARGFTSFDPDADGPLNRMLYAAGGLISGGPGTVNHLYRWDEIQWTPFGNFVSSNGPAFVEDVAAFDSDGDGPAPRQLVVVGAFNRVDGVIVTNCAVYDGQQWRAMGSGFNVNPFTAFTWDRFGDGREVVLVAGSFTAAGGVPARGLALWNGSAWSSLGAGFSQDGGTPGYPADLRVFDLDSGGPAPAHLYAAGGFAFADNLPARGIARWTGSAWESLGAGVTGGAVMSLAVLPASDSRPARLAVGGFFSGAGGRPSAYFAQYGVISCCAADFNADGYVNSSDLFSFLEAFFTLEPRADVNADGFIDSADLFEVLTGLFGGC